MKRFITILFILSTTILHASDRVEEISLKSSITFNTLCSKCHEGQCSGRMTFDIENEIATNHIKRYAESIDISKKEVEEFFTLLNYMKKECLLFMPQSAKYNQNNLATFATSSKRDYFIPLGELKKGSYTLLIKTKEDTPFTMELISNKFDISLDVTVCQSLKKREFELKIDEDRGYFLRINSKKPLYLEQLDIKKVNVK